MGMLNVTEVSLKFGRTRRSSCLHLLLLFRSAAEPLSFAFALVRHWATFPAGHLRTGQVMASSRILEVAARIQHATAGDGQGPVRTRGDCGYRYIVLYTFIYCFIVIIICVCKCVCRYVIYIYNIYKYIICACVCVCADIM